MSIVLTRATKQAARYTDAGGRERCSGCRFFMPQGTCGRIVGPVSPRGWCKYYSMEAVQRWQPQGAIGFGMGPSLVLDFMNANTMPTGINFLRGSNAAYFDGAGTMRTAATNVPRWDYDPVTHALRGLLIEKTATNLMLNSANFTAASWIGAAVTATAGVVGAPDGTASMSRIAETAAATALHYTAQSMTVAASTPLSFSVYASASGVRYLQLALTDGANNGGYATFDLQAGTISQALAAVGTGTIGTASIQSIGASIYRLRVGITTAAPTAGQILLITSNSATPGFAPSYTGSPANSVLLWGAQAEQELFATSYIPTTTATVTRSSDYAAVATGGWFTPAAGTVAADFIAPNPAGAGGVWGGVLRMDDTTDTNQAVIFMAPSSNTIAFYGVAGGVTEINTTAIPTTGTSQRIAIRYGAPLWQGAMSGALYAGTGSATPFSATRILIGVAHSTTAWPLNGYVRRVSYWPRALSNAEMQQVTT